MGERKNRVALFLFVCSACLIAASFTAVMMAKYSEQKQFQMLNAIVREIIEVQPEGEQTVIAALKNYKEHPAPPAERNILTAFGYQPRDLLKFPQTDLVLFAAAGFLLGSILFVSAFLFRSRREALRIEGLTASLEQINRGKPVLLPQRKEDDFSKLEDEIYKTVTMLYETREAALEAKSNFSDNLFNIAHQLKTPITAISLSAQMMKEYRAAGHAKAEYAEAEYPEQIGRQLERLTRLEEALLLLARLDSGTLSFELKAVDVYTVLSLAADNLQELFVRSGVLVEIPELGEISLTADLDWTMEAIMNLMKNCMEHTPAGGVVHCSYSQNPLYTQIEIWDEGQGFTKEDSRHLFDRFYRGRNARGDGIGIGLSLAKAIIEGENGVIRAGNHKSGGACFEIRIYSH